MELNFFREEEEEITPLTVKIKWASIGTSVVVSASGIILYIIGMTQMGWAVFLLGLALGIIPVGMLSFLKNRAIGAIEDQFPSFLKDLAESKRGGMTLVDAFESAKTTDYGRLNPEIKKMHNQLTWGVPFPKVIERFSHRLEDSSVIQEATSILLQGFKSGGNITKTIESVGENVTELKEAIDKKNSMIKQQVVIMYVIYFIFVGITIGIYLILVQLLGLGDPTGGALSDVDLMGASVNQDTNYCSGQIMLANPLCETAKLFGFVPSNVSDFTSEYAETYSYGNMAYYKSILFSMLMLQGLLSGAVIGQISDGEPSAGLKHVLVLLPVAFILFMSVVGSAGV